jgi:NADPH:quinone reductase-like Zn-dependent oxidoreductase
MKAVVFNKYGTPEVLKLKEIKKPVPKDNEVLVAVYAASINDWDWQILQGIPFVNRLEAGIFKPSKVQILGSDIAGRIEAVGKEVKHFQPGDEVYGDLSGKWGGFAEYVCALEKQLTKKPAGMTFEQAAAIPQAGTLAMQGLIDHGHIRQGQKLLINGAGGGVGTLGVQIAKLHGVEVTGVDSSTKMDTMRSIGFDHVIDYTQEDFTKNGQCYDLILDTKSNRSPFDIARSLHTNGTYVTVGGAGLRIMQTVFLGPLFSIISKKNMRLVILKLNKDLTYLSELFNTGKIKPIIDKCYRLQETSEALTHFGAANHKGKVVITMEHI